MTSERIQPWPALPLQEWRDTYETIHRWAQIVGKVQLALSPTLNHWWHVPLQVTARGLATSSIMASGGRWLDMELDFFADVLRIRISDGTAATVALAARPVADFYTDTVDVLRHAGIPVHLFATPVEIEDRTPFPSDTQHHAYDKQWVMAFWRIVGRATLLLTKFRSGYLGKSSPVQFYWGHFDLTLSLFSGRKAELGPGLTDPIEREAYSHELFAIGWWPGDARHEKPAFYSYAAPEPPGFSTANITTPGVYYHPTLRGFYLDYDDVRTAPDPDGLILDFFHSTYTVAAEFGNWDRSALERHEPMGATL